VSRRPVTALTTMAALLSAGNAAISETLPSGLPAASPTQSTVVDDASMGWMFSGMQEFDNPDLFGGSGHAGSPGSTGAYTFNGTGIAVYAMTGPSVQLDGRFHKMGMVRISIDGHLKASESLLRGDTQYKVMVFNESGLPPGNHVLQVAAADGWIVVDYIQVSRQDKMVESTSAPSDREDNAGDKPYGGIPARIPGTIYAANYNVGGQHVAYFDTTTGNAGAVYRHDDVDIEKCTAMPDSYDIGAADNGEWLKYTVSVEATRTYALTFRIASQGQGWLHVEDESGANITGPVYVPNTGGWQQWSDISGSVRLTAGTHVLKLCEDTGGYNIFYLRLQ